MISQYFDNIRVARRMGIDEIIYDFKPDIEHDIIYDNTHDFALTYI